MTNLATIARDVLRAARARPLLAGPRAFDMPPAGRRDRLPTLRVMTYGRVVDEAAVRARNGRVLAGIERAHAFAFEDYPVETDAEGRTTMPNPTPDEVGFFARRLLPLPFPTSFLSFDRDGTAVGVLVEERDDRVDVTRVEHFPDADALFVSPFTLEVSYGDGPSARFEDGLGLLGAYRARVAELNGVDPADHAALDRVMTSDAMTMIYLVAMLSSTSSEVESHGPRPFATRRRRAAGLDPEMPHRVVRLLPRAVRDAIAADGDGERAHRRIHWRRSHLRTLADGRQVVVARHVVGYRSLADKEALAPNAYAATAALAAAAGRGRGR